MSSTPLPSASDNYAAPPKMRLGAAEWNAALTDVGGRLVALEAERASFDALIAQGTSGALAIISTNVGPQLAALQASIATLQSAVVTVQGAVTNAQNQLTAILAGSLPATNVTFMEAGFASLTAEAAIVEAYTRAAALSSANAAALVAARSELLLRANLMTGMI